MVHADLLQLIAGRGIQGDRAAGGVGQGRAVIGQTGVVDVFVGEIGPINGLGPAAACGHQGQAQSQHEGQQGTETHGEKPQRQGENWAVADPTGGTRQP